MAVGWSGRSESNTSIFVIFPDEYTRIEVVCDWRAIGVRLNAVLQELLRGSAGPRARKDIIERFSALPLLTPDRPDYIDAAELRNLCRRSGVQLGTINALLAQLCIRHALILLTTDNDFVLAARHCDLSIWSSEN